MASDIDACLRDWQFKPGIPQARVIRARDGRQVVQLRVDLGVLQLEADGRPDGERPHECETYLAYLEQQARRAQKKGKKLRMSAEQCAEADREFVQYYHRRLCWLTLRQFDRAVRDADHTIRFMDFVKEHSPSEEYTNAHEQYRGFVLFHRTEAAASLEIARERPQAALEAILSGLEQIRAFFAEHGAEAQFDDDFMVKQLRQKEDELRLEHKIEAPLEERLRQAVDREDYEAAAKLRDEIRRREQP